MNRRMHFYYWILPTLVVGLLMAAYFSGVPALVNVVAPEFNRELGLLENLQNLVLIGVMVVAFKGIRRAPSAPPRLALIFILLVTFFLFLEEINYGQHYWNALHGVSKANARYTLSLHNVGDNSDRFKHAGDAVILLFFVALPLVAHHRGPGKLRYFVPPRAIITTVLAMLVLSRIAHALNAMPAMKGLLRKSISEFRELFTYYLGLLYVGEIALRRQWPGLAGHLEPAREARLHPRQSTGEDHTAAAPR